MASFVVKVVQNDGTVLETLNDIAFDQVTWELNGPGSMDFTVHNYDTTFTATDILTNEVQLWRNGTFLWWGVPVRAEATPTRVRVSCRGLLWYFSRRFIGDADRTNYLSNPEFNGNLTSWTAQNTTATAVTTQRILGTHSAQLVQATAQQDAYLHQTFSITGTAIGTLVVVVAWYRITSTGWLGEAINKRGLTVSRKTGSTIHESSVYEIDGASPRDAWQRAEVSVWVPPGTTNDIQVRLYSPGGTIHWDATSATIMESLSNYNADQTDIASQIVLHLQDTAYGKSDLAIATSTPASGVLRDRHYQHADHHSGMRALAEFTLLEDGFDFDVAVTSTTRTFTTYYPRKGGTPSQLDFTAARLSDWTLRIDGEAACSSITVLGDGDGPDREEGAAVDDTVFGGLILEDVIMAPPGAPIDSLDARAEEALRLRKKAQVLTVVVPAVDADNAITYIGNIAVGDVGTPTLAEGFSTVAGNWRLVRMTLDGSDALTLELNPE